MSEDGLVSVDTTYCTGLCDQGPALLINHHQVVTRMNPSRVDHMAALIDALNKAKPASSKGVYLRKVAVSSTMGVGVRVEVQSIAA